MQHVFHAITDVAGSESPEDGRRLYVPRSSERCRSTSICVAPNTKKNEKNGMFMLAGVSILSAVGPPKKIDLLAYFPSRGAAHSKPFALPSLPLTVALNGRETCFTVTWNRSCSPVLYTDVHPSVERQFSNVIRRPEREDSPIGPKFHLWFVPPLYSEYRPRSSRTIRTFYVRFRRRQWRSPICSSQKSTNEKILQA